MPPFFPEMSLAAAFCPHLIVGTDTGCGREDVEAMESGFPSEYNYELAKFASIFRAGPETVSLLALAGGAVISPIQAQRMMNGGMGAYVPCSREVFVAVLEGVIVLKREFRGDWNLFLTHFRRVSAAGKGHG